MIFSIREFCRVAIGEGMRLKTWREKEGDEDNSKIAIKHDRDSEIRKVRTKPSIYTQNWTLMCI